MALCPSLVNLVDDAPFPLAVGAARGPFCSLNGVIKMPVARDEDAPSQPRSPDANGHAPAANEPDLLTEAIDLSDLAAAGAALARDVEGLDLQQVRAGEVSVPGHQASRLAAAAQRVHDLSWRGVWRFDDVVRAEFEQLLKALLPILEKVIAAVEPTKPAELLKGEPSADSKPAKRARLDAGLVNDDGASVDCPAVECVRSLAVALELIVAYVDLITVFGISNTVYVDGVNEAVVRLLRSQFRGTLPAVFDDPDERRRRREGRQGLTLGSAVGGSLRQQLAQRGSAALLRMHGYISRVVLPDHQLHQLVYLCVHSLFLADPVAQMSLAAIEVLTVVFARFPNFRDSIVQECLSLAVKVPVGRRAKRYVIAFEGVKLTTFSLLLLKLLQSTCLPLDFSAGESDGVDVVPQLAPLVSKRLAMKESLKLLIGGLIERCVLRTDRDSDARLVIIQLTQDLLQASSHPSWIAASDLLRALLAVFIHGLISGKKAEKTVDVGVREFAIRLLGEVGKILQKQHVEASRHVLCLPEANSDPDLPSDAPVCFCGQTLPDALQVVCRDCGWKYHGECVGLSKKQPTWYCDRCTLRRIAVKLQQSDTFRSRPEAAVSTLPQELIFKHLILSWVNSTSSTSGAALWTPPRDPSQPAGSMCSLAEVIFGAEHPIHCRSYMLAQWAEMLVEACKKSQMDTVGPDDNATSEEPALKKLRPTDSPVQLTEQEQLLVGFLWREWTAPVERSSRAAPLVSKYAILRLHRQMMVQLLDQGRKLLLAELVAQSASPFATLRKSAMRALGELVAADVNLVREPNVEYVIQVRSLDDSALVRQMSLDLLGRLLAQAETEDDDEVVGADNPLAAEVLPAYLKVVRGRVSDTSILVRRKAVWILSRLVIHQPRDHPDVVPVCVELVKRVNDSDAMKKMVLNTFEQVFFAESQHVEPTVARAVQLAHVVDAAALHVSQTEFVEDLLRRFRSSLGAGDAAFLETLRAWVRVLFSAFSDLDEAGGEDHSVRRAVVNTLVAISSVKPEALLDHVRPMCQFLRLDPVGATELDRWVALRVLGIVAPVVPFYAAARADRRLCNSYETVLLQLIARQGATLVRGAVKCLCLVVQHWTHNVEHVVKLLVDAVGPTQGILEALNRQDPNHTQRLSGEKSRYLCRAAYIMCSILEIVDITSWIRQAETDAPDNGQRRPVPALPKEKLRFRVVDDVPSTVAQVLLNLYELHEAPLENTVVTCLGFFLSNNREHVKSRKLQQVIEHSLRSNRRDLVLRSLVMLHELLTTFEHAATAEADFNAKSGLKGDREAHHLSASESAGPLAVNHLQQVLALLTGQLTVFQEAVECDAELRLAALRVVQSMDTQGLLNPYLITPAVFSLLWYGERTIEGTAARFLKRLLDLRPQLLLNRLDQALIASFNVLLERFPDMMVPGRRLPLAVNVAFAAVAELYCERFRKSKTSREQLIACLLREISKGTGLSVFSERFPTLCILQDRIKPSAGAVISGSEKLNSADFHRMLYGQFVASVLLSLPFQFESEPLYAIYHCDRYVDLHADALVSKGEQAAEEIGDEDPFGVCVSSVIMRVVKSSLRAEYKLDEDRCQTYEPNETKQEKAKYASYATDQDKTEAAKSLFSYEAFLAICEPFVAKAESPRGLIAELSKLLTESAGASNAQRYLQILAKGEAKRRGKGKGKERGRAEQIANEDVDKGDQKDADEEEGQDEEDSLKVTPRKRFGKRK